MSSIAGSKGLVTEEIGRDRVPWSTGRYCEKPDSGPSSDRTCAGKSLILQDTRVQIPYAAEQGNKSDDQGDKIDDQGIKSAEHGTARQVSSGRLWRPAGAPAPARRAPGALGRQSFASRFFGYRARDLKDRRAESRYAARCARACAD
jgi:hypothetical protein